MSTYTLSSDGIALPTGAWARTERLTLRHAGKAVLGLTQGRRRCYVYPLYTPAGFAVTSESPADHPHHNSLWIAADHVHCRMPVDGGKFEDYTYNFYVDDTFQGRASGRIVDQGATLTDNDGASCRIEQAIEWRGPEEWAAPRDGRLVARERRVLAITRTDRTTLIDVTSELAATDWAFSLGPTRHAYFNVRVADSMIVVNGGAVFDDRGETGGAAITGDGARWVCFEGPVGGGHRAGIVVFPHPEDHAELSWFVTDWGVVTVGPFRLTGRLIDKGHSLTARYRVVAFDGAAADLGLDALYDDYLESGKAQSRNRSRDPLRTDRRNPQ